MNNEDIFMSDSKLECRLSIRKKMPSCSQCGVGRMYLISADFNITGNSSPSIGLNYTCDNCGEFVYIRQKGVTMVKTGDE